MQKHTTVLLLAQEGSADAISRFLWSTQAPSYQYLVHLNICSFSCYMLGLLRTHRDVPMTVQLLHGRRSSGRHRARPPLMPHPTGSLRELSPFSYVHCSLTRAPTSLSSLQFQTSSRPACCSGRQGGSDAVYPVHLVEREWGGAGIQEHVMPSHNEVFLPVG